MSGLMLAKTLAVLARFSGGSAGYDADAQAVFNAMATQPDATRKGHINTLITALKSAGVWSKLDHFVVCANTAAADGLLDWKNPSTPWTAVSSPTFTSDRGYAGDGVSAHIIGPTTYSAMTNFTQNGAHLALWSRTAASGANYDLGVNAATSSVRLRLRNSSTITAHINQTSGSYGAVVTDASGFFVATRSASTVGEVFRNGASILSITATSTSRPALAPTLFRYDATYSSREIALLAIGGDVTSEQSAYYSAVSAYMIAVGAA